MLIITYGLKKETLRYLKHIGKFKPHTIGSEEEVLEMLQHPNHTFPYQAAVVSLSRVSHTWLSKMRALSITMPVVMVTDQLGDFPKLRACTLTQGADDLVHEEHVEELVASILASARRYWRLRNVSPIIEAGPIAVNTFEKSLSVDGIPILLHNLEYKVVELLAIKIEQEVSRSLLMEYIYGGEDEPFQKILDVLVCWLRKKIEIVHPGASGHIYTVWGLGYKLCRKIPEHPGVKKAKPSHQAMPIGHLAHQSSRI